MPITTLLRAIGYETDKDILDIFNLAEEVKVSKAGLKRVCGRKLAARVLHSYYEDFVNEDTGECVSIERNEVIIDRDVELQEEHIQKIVDSGVKTILLHIDQSAEEKVSDYSVIFNTLQKIHVILLSKQSNIFTASCVMPNRPMRKPPAMSSISCSSRISVMTWAWSAVTASTVS